MICFWHSSIDSSRNPNKDFFKKPSITVACFQGFLQKIHRNNFRSSFIKLFKNCFWNCTNNTVRKSFRYSFWSTSSYFKIFLSKSSIDSFRNISRSFFKKKNLLGFYQDILQILLQNRDCSEDLLWNFFSGIFRNSSGHIFMNSYSNYFRSRSRASLEISQVNPLLTLAWYLSAARNTSRNSKEKYRVSIRSSSWGFYYMGFFHYRTN